jgi:predicted Co/Zn/Cd cation transporter (cation efflux family)
MPRQKKNIVHKNYTSIAQAEDLPLAEDCVRLLKDNEIEGKIEPAKKHTYMIKVEEGRFHEAYVIIQSHLTAEGFFDIHTVSQQTKDPTQAA